MFASLQRNTFATTDYTRHANFSPFSYAMFRRNLDAVADLERPLTRYSISLTVNRFCRRGFA